MTHIESVSSLATARLSREIDADFRWLNWIARAEDMLGCEIDGFAMEAAYGYFLEGACVVEYVLDAKARKES